MRLYEFVDPEDSNARAASIIAVANQLKQHVDQGKVDADDFTVDQLLDYFQKNDIILDRQDLYTMIEKPLLKNIVSNIQGDKVVFKGKEQADVSPQQQDQQQKTVASMAKSALNART
jgi:hypothetical protein